MTFIIRIAGPARTKLAGRNSITAPQNPTCMRAVQYTGLLALPLAALALACACAPRRLVAAPPTHPTDVTLSSLDCDVVMWRRIFFHDEHDRVVAEADSGPPLAVADGGCVVHFSVRLPEAKSYVLDNGTRRSSPISFAELRASQFRITVPLR